MDNNGLTKQEQKTLEPYFLSSYGVPPSQEQLMKMLRDPDICNFSLAEANAARKIVGKKQLALLLDGNIVKPKGLPTLAKESDKRAAISSALDDFEEIS